MTQTATFKTFLRHLHRGGAFGYWWTDTGKLSTWWPVDAPSPIPTTPTNVYFGVHPVTAIPPTNGTGEPREPEHVRSQTRYIAGVNCLFAEFDAKDFGHSLEAAKAHIDNLQLQPSVLIFSGGGYHAYWLLRDTFAIRTDDDRQRARQVQARWVKFTGGDDGAKDLARVLRVPGTKNHKSVYAPDWPTVTVVNADLERVFDLEQLENLLDTAGIPTETTWERPQSDAPTGGRPGDDFNTRGNVLPILEAHGWTVVSESDGKAALRRPGKTEGTSATFNHDGTRRFYCFSSNAPPFEAGRYYSAFAVYTMLESSGDYPAASRALRGKGLGETVTPTPETTENRKQKRLTTDEYLALFKSWGYKIRLNLCDDGLEIDGKPIDDIARDVIFAKVRDYGIGHKLGVSVAHASESMSVVGKDNAYHPLKDYLAGLTWDGTDHIKALAGYFTDRDKVFHRWIQHWLCGAVSKIYTGFQNPMLVLDGAQNIGKSFFANWLCPLKSFFNASAILPEAKDHRLRLLRTWVWEVVELGTTSRKADIEALKAFLTLETVRERRPYGRYEIIKPALSSFVGTINSQGGFLADRSGNRRFLVCTLTGIDWAYSKDVDVNQVWAQAAAACASGTEFWDLSETDRKLRDELNENYNVAEPIEVYLDNYLTITGNGQDWVSSSDILDYLATQGFRLSTGTAMKVAAIIKKKGGEKHRRSVGGKRTQGYTGVKIAQVDNLDHLDNL